MTNIRKVNLGDALQPFSGSMLSAPGYDFSDRKATWKSAAGAVTREWPHLILVATAGQVIGYAHAASYDCPISRPCSPLALAVTQIFKGRDRALMQALREEVQAAGYTGMPDYSRYFSAHLLMNFIVAHCSEKADQKRFYWEF